MRKAANFIFTFFMGLGFFEAVNRLTPIPMGITVVVATLLMVMNLAIDKDVRPAKHPTFNDVVRILSKNPNRYIFKAVLFTLGALGLYLVAETF